MTEELGRREPARGLHGAAAMGIGRRLFVSLSAALATLYASSEGAAAIIVTEKTSTPHPGVTLIEGTTRAPSSRFQATKIALCTNGVRVDATAPPTGFRTVPGWAQSVGAEVAVNGDFYRPELRVQGMAVGGGKAWPLTRTGIDPAVADEFYYERFGWIAFGPDFVEFTHTEHVKKNPAKFNATQGYSPTKVVHTYPKGTIALVSGFPELVTEGKRYTCATPTTAGCFPDRTDMRSRHPRSAMGISQDRRTFILAVVDGRSNTSAGMYGTELAELMSELGAWQAYNIDGGGSSEMWIKGLGTVNDPSDGTSRAVANHWGIFTGNAGPGAHCMKLPPADAGADASAPADGAGTGDGTAAPDGPPGGGDQGPGADPDGSLDDAASAEGCAQSPGSTGSSGAAAFLLVLVSWGALRRVRRRA